MLALTNVKELAYGQDVPVWHGVKVRASETERILKLCGKIGMEWWWRKGV